MSAIHVQYVGTSCKLTTMPMRAGRRGRRKQKKTGKVLQTQFVGVNTCMFKMVVSLLCNQLRICDHQ